jgi:hypothetical protein
MAEVRIESAAAGTLARAGAPIAEAEGFSMHAQSMLARLQGRAQPPTAVAADQSQSEGTDQAQSPVIGDNPQS